MLRIEPGATAWYTFFIRKTHELGARGAIYRFLRAIPVWLSDRFGRAAPT